MSGSSHGGLVPRASNTNRGEHPDIDPLSGQVKWEAYIDPDRRAFLELWGDPVKKAAFMDGVAERQRREHPSVQEWVSGVEYPGPDPLQSFTDYQADLQRARDYYGRTNEVTSYDVADMTLEQYDRVFDEHGRPREGYTYRRTDRDISPAAEDGIDRASRDESRRLR